MIDDAAALILAGGSGRRMGGVNKSLLPYRGRTVIEAQLDVLSPLFANIAISTNDPAPFARFGLPVIADRLGAGPVAGIEAGLAWCPKPRLFVLACDLPSIDAAIILDLAQQRADAVVVADQPLCGFYARSCQPILAARLAAGEYRAMDLIQNEPGLSVCVRMHALSNWNHPEDCLD